VIVAPRKTTDPARASQKAPTGMPVRGRDVPPRVSPCTLVPEPDPGSETVGCGVGVLEDVGLVVGVGLAVGVGVGVVVGVGVGVGVGIGVGVGDAVGVGLGTAPAANSIVMSV
jgi:hypothetical protein